MKTYSVDVSVLLLFHARPDHFSKVWAEVKEARPARLFLYQDGPRMVDKNGNAVADASKSKDWTGIQACRELVADENIDWECEVHRNYQEKNAGCDPSGFNSQRWAFSQTDKCIVLEDDVVPSQSFFTFCKEMLDRYENDERITMIAGFNTDEITPATEIGGASYFFTRAFSIWGWASWSRVVNNWPADFDKMSSREYLDILKSKTALHKQNLDTYESFIRHNESGISYFETLFWAYMMMHDGLAVMPAVNMINNIGLEGGTHYSTNLNLLPRRLRRQFEMSRQELETPYIHQEIVAEYPDYQKRLFLMNGWNNPWRKVQYSFEELWLNLIRGNFKTISKAAWSRMMKLLCYNKRLKK